MCSVSVGGQRGSGNRMGLGTCYSTVERCTARGRGVGWGGVLQDTLGIQGQDTGLVRVL